MKIVLSAAFSDFDVNIPNLPKLSYLLHAKLFWKAAHASIGPFKAKWYLNRWYHEIRRTENRLTSSCSCSCGVAYRRLWQVRLRSVGFTTSWVVCITTSCKNISSEYPRVRKLQPGASETQPSAPLSAARLNRLTSTQNKWKCSFRKWLRLF